MGSESEVVQKTLGPCLSLLSFWSKVFLIALYQTFLGLRVFKKCNVYISFALLLKYNRTSFAFLSGPHSNLVSIQDFFYSCLLSICKFPQDLQFQGLAVQSPAPSVKSSSFGMRAGITQMQPTVARVNSTSAYFRLSRALRQFSRILVQVGASTRANNVCLSSCTR